MERLPLGELIRWQAERRPDAPCLTCDGQSLTWAAFERRANRLARAYADAGVGQDDLVTIALPNGLPFFEAVTAVWKLGATPNPISGRLPAVERIDLIRTANPALVVGVAPDEAAGYPALPADFVPPANLSDAPLAPAVATYWKAMPSGGSTGRPKIIVDHMKAQYSPDATLLGLAPDRTVLIPGPLYHNGPFSMAHYALFAGNHVVVMPRFDPLEVLALVERHRVDWLLLVPTMMSRIWRLGPEARSRFDLSSLRMVVHMAAACPPWLKERWIDWLGPERVCEFYGGAERQGSTWINGNEWLSHRGSVGRVRDGFSVKILDECGDALPSGEVGEIYFLPDEGAGSTYHYIGAAPRRRGEWDSLGDLGYLDKDGYLYLSDRRTDLIVSGGRNIYPAEVEGAVEAHPDVAACVAIGLPDEDMGQVVHAILNLRDGGDPAAVTAQLPDFLRARVAGYKVPRSYEVVDAPLRDDAGKVRRAALRDARIGAAAKGA